MQPDPPGSCDSSLGERLSFGFLEVSGMNTESPGAPLLFAPPDARSSRCVAFLTNVNKKYGLALDSYFDLYRWSIGHIDSFWDTVWDEVAIVGYKGQGVVDNNALPAANPPWFSEARINWAENMLTCRSPDKFALIQASTLIQPYSLIYAIIMAD